MTAPVPNPKFQAFDANGDPLSGGKLYSYAAGTTTPLATYTDYAGGTPNANPVVLDARGEANIWLSAYAYKFVLKNSADVEIWTVDNLNQQNIDEWIRAIPVTYASAASFTVSGDQTSEFHIGRRVKLIGAATGTVYGTIKTSVYTTLTTVTFVADTGSLSNEVLTAYVSILRADHSGRHYESIGRVSLWPFLSDAQKADVHVGTALVDCASAFRTALAYVNALGGGTLYVPPGTYLMESLTGTDPYQCFAALYPNVSLLCDPWTVTLKAAANLSVSNQWNYFVLKTSSNFERVMVKGFIFDFNGTNNLTPAPPGTYRPCLGVWVIVEGTGTATYVEVADCIFKDNPGGNSVSVVDAAPAGGLNAIGRIWLHHNAFVNFGYLVGDSLNVNCDDHSCIYVQAHTCLIDHNYFIQDYTLNEASVIGMSAIDLHAAYCSISDNIAYNVHTLVSHQTNAHNALDVLICNNLCERLDRLYAFFDGGSGNTAENIRICQNLVAFPASNRSLPCIDLWSATVAETPNNVVIDGNTFMCRAGTLTGKTTPIIKVRRGDNLQITNNHAWNVLGEFLYYAPNAAMSRVLVAGNMIGAYGLGEVAGSKVGMYIDNDGHATLNAFVCGNLIHNGSLSTREAGIKFAGAIGRLIVDNNEIVGATKKCTTTSFNVAEFFIRRGKLHVSSYLNCGPPGAVPGLTTVLATVTGAAVGDIARVAYPGALPANYLLNAYVTAPDQVTVQWAQLAGAPADPDAGGAYYRITVDQMGVD